MKITYSFECKCGKRVEQIESKTAAEVQADRHEAQFISRRAYAHDTNVNMEVR